jgi:hypothetical protein
MCHSWPLPMIHRHYTFQTYHSPFSVPLWRNWNHSYRVVNLPLCFCIPLKSVIPGLTPYTNPNGTFHIRRFCDASLEFYNCLKVFRFKFGGERNFYIINILLNIYLGFMFIDYFLPWNFNHPWIENTYYLNSSWMKEKDLINMCLI